jgi:SAM-dependent methyltransferase
MVMKCFYRVKAVLEKMACVIYPDNQLGDSEMTLKAYSYELNLIEQQMIKGGILTPLILKNIPLDVLGLLYLSGSDEYPYLKAQLPEMPSDEVQQQWTGAAGHTLMAQSCAFVKTMIGAFEQITGKSLESSHVLDYGCGWGRLSRLMLKYVPQANIWAVDPWDESIKLCQQHRMLVHLAISDYVPDSLPVGVIRFDLMFAFSVFTHLSQKTAQKVLKVLRDYAQDDALLVITIRPPEYWTVHSNFPPDINARKMIAKHNSSGFAFIPHNRPPINGEVTYGDTSISLEYIKNSWQGWNIYGTELNLVDPYQLIVFMRPA